MQYAGIDLHKHSITVCVTDRECARRRTHQFPCNDTTRIREFFVSLTPFQAVVEATAGYEWLLQLIEPIAARVVLANPKKLRVIAESTNKSDKLDARVLAEFLARDMVPQAYRPTPRQREHRALVRHRQFLKKMKTQVSNKVRRIVSDSNADRRDLFTKEGREYLDQLPLSEVDRFVVKDLLAQRDDLEARLAAVKLQLLAFAKRGAQDERRQRELLRSIPGVGPITTEVVLAELGDVRRFRSAKQVVSYSGLAPGRRESAGKSRDLGITKEGPPLLRWILVEAGWQTIRRSSHWREVYDRIGRRRGVRRAIVAVARRLLELIFALLRDDVPYKEPEGATPKATRKIVLRRT